MESKYEREQREKEKQRKFEAERQARKDAAERKEQERKREWENRQRDQRESDYRKEQEEKFESFRKEHEEKINRMKEEYESQPHSKNDGPSNASNRAYMRAIMSDANFDSVEEAATIIAEEIEKAEEERNKFLLWKTSFFFIGWYLIVPGCIYWTHQYFGNYKITVLAAAFFYGIKAMGISMQADEKIKRLERLESFSIHAIIFACRYEDMKERLSEYEDTSKYNYDCSDEEPKAKSEQNNANSESNSESSSQANVDDLDRYRDFLGVKKGCSKSEIRKAYIARIKKAHPDKGGSTEDAKKTNEAYSKLMAA